ncbi:MAG: VOC family protein [Cyanobium sp.]
MNSSIVLAADAPAQLAGFYANLLNTEPQQGMGPKHWRLAWPGGGFLEIYAPSRSRPQPRQQGRLAICLQRHANGGDAAAMLKQLIEAATGLGATQLDPPRLESFGAEAWLLDPEGNRLLLLVLA